MNYLDIPEGSRWVHKISGDSVVAMDVNPATVKYRDEDDAEHDLSCSVRAFLELYKLLEESK